MTLEMTQNCLPEEMDSGKEKDVRKQWIISLFIFAATNYISDLPYCLLLIPDNFNLLAVFIGMHLTFIVSSLTIFLIPYRFAYKKSGTKWLMFTLITLPLVKVGDIACWSLIFDGDFFDGYVLLIPLGTALYYWIHCLRLRKINVARKRKLKQKKLVCAEAV